MVSAEKPEEIKSMFASIAHRYDLLNHLLSLSVDRYWRYRVVKEIDRAVAKRPILALDLCCGTADLALSLSRLGKVIGCDFCHPMLVRGNAKIRKKTKANKIFLAEGDALRLPFSDNSFDVVTVAFGLRNLADLRAGLTEMHRVLRPDGTLAVLEFSKPVASLFRLVFKFYFTKILPRIGQLVSGQLTPYRYLPASVSAFPDQQDLKRIMQELGFHRVRFRNMTGGIAALHLGSK